MTIQYTLTPYNMEEKNNSILINNNTISLIIIFINNTWDCTITSNHIGIYNIKSTQSLTTNLYISNKNKLNNFNSLQKDLASLEYVNYVIT